MRITTKKNSLERHTLVVRLRNIYVVDKNNQSYPETFVAGKCVCVCACVLAREVVGALSVLSVAHEGMVAMSNRCVGAALS